MQDAEAVVLCRMVLAIALSMLIIGTLANSRSRQSCNILNHRLLSVGGVLCFIHGLFIVPYYVSAAATKREEKKRQEHSQSTTGQRTHTSI